MKIVVTGASGFVGLNLVAALKARGCRDVCGVGRENANVMDSHAVENVLQDVDIVFHLAARCGGIGINQKRPAVFIRDNLLMGLNVIHSASVNGVKKTIMVGTLCAFPKDTPNDIEAADLWNGYPEPTNAPYGIAKRTLVEVGKAYHQQYGLNVVNVMPTNMYGPGDNFDPETSHVIPALIRRLTEARNAGLPEVTCWGTGGATRDFLYVTDAVEALSLAAERINDPEPICIGTGAGVTMSKLADMIAEQVGYTGRILWDSAKPDGQPTRVVGTRDQINKLAFTPKIDLLAGIALTVEAFEAMQAVKLLVDAVETTPVSQSEPVAEQPKPRRRAKKMESTVNEST